MRIHSGLLLLLCPFLLACGGKLNETPSTDGTARLEQAWATYYAAIDEARQNFLNSDSYKIDSAHRAGAFQLLQSLIGSNVIGMMNGGDGTYPHIRLLLSPAIKIGVDNPDTLYRAATISNPDGSTVYRVWGNRGTASDFLLEQFYGPDPNGAISVFEDEELVTDADGNFELFLSATRQGENWMELAPTERLLTLIIRDSHTNWDTEQAGQIHIERLGAQGVPSPVQDEVALVRTIETATAILRRQGQFWPDFSSKLRLVGQNNFTKFRATEMLGIPTQFYTAGFFSVAADEALIVTLGDVDAGYCGLQLTSFWAASPDWINRQTSLNWCNPGSQAHQSADGSYTFVVSPQDPAVQNWIDTSGFTQGVLYARIQSPRTDPSEFSKPVTKLVSMSELSAELPQDMRMLDDDARAAQLISRQRHAQRRYQSW